MPSKSWKQTVHMEPSKTQWTYEHREEKHMHTVEKFRIYNLSKQTQQINGSHTITNPHPRNLHTGKDTLGTGSMIEPQNHKNKKMRNVSGQLHHTEHHTNYLSASLDRQHQKNTYRGRKLRFLILLSKMRNLSLKHYRLLCWQGNNTIT
jgi:hypothetical protein